MKLYYFEDKRTGKRRNTAVVANSAAAAKAKLKRPSAQNARVYSSRKPTAAEAKDIRAGRWVRTRANGAGPSADNKRGYGPKRK